MKTLTILIGPHGSGKTTAAEIMMEEYMQPSQLTHIEADQMGYDDCPAVVKRALTEGESVVLCGVYFTAVQLIKYIHITSDLKADLIIKRMPQEELLDG